MLLCAACSVACTSDQQHTGRQAQAAKLQLKRETAAAADRFCRFSQCQGCRSPVPYSPDTGCSGKSNPQLLHAAYSAHVACMQQ